MSAVVQAAGPLRWDKSIDADGEYLDVLGERDPIGLHRGQFASARKGAEDGC